MNRMVSIGDGSFVRQATKDGTDFWACPACFAKGHGNVPLQLVHGTGAKRDSWSCPVCGKRYHSDKGARP